ncbi:unnamed protein product [Ectocarpus sp. 8 AP-2014]
MEEEDSGPIIREMRVQVRPRGEYGSRGARRIRRAGKVPGVVYSNSDNRGHSSRPGGGVGRPADDPILVKVDKIVLDREVRRLNASFDNTVYDLVIEGETSSGNDAADDGIEVTVADPGAGGDRGKEEEEGASAGEGGVEGGAQHQQQPERRELVLANQSRLHPVFRTLLSVNWIRYKAGRKYPIPIKFINSDLNENFRKGAYIRRRTHQHILLPEDPEMVPKWLYLDLEFVRSGSKLRVSDLMMPEGILLHRANEPGMWNEVVCTIKGRKVFASGDSAGDDEDEVFVDDEA